MKHKGKWGIFWEQLSADPEIIGTLIIGTPIFLFEYLNVIFTSEITSMLFIVLGGMVLSLLLAGIFLYARRAYRITKSILAPKHIPVVCIVGQPREEAEAIMTKAQRTITRRTGFKEFKQLENSLNISYSELIVHSRQRLRPELGDWVDFIKDAQGQIRRFVDRIPGNKIYHIFIYGPSSLAMGLGTAFGDKHTLVAHQYIDGEYEPVIDLTYDIRRIKTKQPEPNQYIQVKTPSRFTADTAVILDLATRPPASDVKHYLKKSNQSMAIVEVNNTYGGNLREPDWCDAVREVFCTLTKIASIQKVEHIHLFHDMPVALAFGVGAALGTFTPITVYNWEAQEQTYYPVLTLNKLESHI